MKTILIIIAVAVAVIQTVARAAEEPAWSSRVGPSARTVAALLARATSADRLTMGNAASFRCGKLTRADTVM